MRERLHKLGRAQFPNWGWDPNSHPSNNLLLSTLVLWENELRWLPFIFIPNKSWLWALVWPLLTPCEEWTWFLCAHVMGLYVAMESLWSWASAGSRVPILPGLYCAEQAVQPSSPLGRVEGTGYCGGLFASVCQGWEVGGWNWTHYAFQCIRLLVLCQAASPLSGITALCIIIYQHSGWLHSLYPFCCGTPLRLGFECKASWYLGINSVPSNKDIFCIS